MGNASSKAARRLPKETSQWAGSRRPAAAAEQARPEKPLAFERRDQAIERDAKDPHLLQNLNRLGPVRVDHHTQTPAASDAQRMYSARARSEAEAAVPGEANRLRAASLAELLDARKAVVSAAELGGLAGRYHVDAATMRLLRVVNTPSVDARTVARTRDEHGEEHVTMMARWVDPVLSRG